jgi:hypothetical protein
MQTNHIPQEVLFARGIRRHIRRLEHLFSEERLVADVLISKLSSCNDEALRNLKVIYPETSQFIDAFVESKEVTQK